MLTSPFASMQLGSAIKTAQDKKKEGESSFTSEQKFVILAVAVLVTFTLFSKR